MCPWKIIFLENEKQASSSFKVKFTSDLNFLKKQVLLRDDVYHCFILSVFIAYLLEGTMCGLTLLLIPG